MLRRGLLTGRAVALAGPPPAAIGQALIELGARVLELDSELDEDGARDWAAAAAPLHALLYDAGSQFADGGGSDALRESLERAWVATRAVATGALIPAGAGKVVLLAPPAGAAFAAAARAALENLVRTLSVEWARYGVSAVAVAPGAATRDDELAELVCFLVSEAGEYFDGCLFELAAG